MSSHTVDDVLQSLRFDAAEHSSSGQRCGQQYEWYQTPSDVVVEIMVPNVKEEDIVAEFSRRKVTIVLHVLPITISMHAHGPNFVVTIYVSSLSRDHTGINRVYAHCCSRVE